ncbi:MAG: SIR2 family NAD-dependent protein deacylase [Jiangellaceae bacterium]
MDTLALVATWLCEASRATVLSGAGISTDSGIPDFRGPQGLWTTNPAAQSMFTLDRYVADREVRVQAWQNRRAHPAWTAEPNAGHAALVALERSGKLRGLVTQNIDELHQRAGSDPALVVEVHGTMRQAECLACGDRQPMHDVLARVDSGDADPWCELCDGMLKSATISFGQSLRPDVWQSAVDAAIDCDVFLAVGSSLQVHPAASLCDMAVGSGARLVVVNAEPTPYDDMADAVLRDPISTVLPALARRCV